MLGHASIAKLNALKPNDSKNLHQSTVQSADEQQIPSPVLSPTEELQISYPEGFIPLLIKYLIDIYHINNAFYREIATTKKTKMQEGRFFFKLEIDNKSPKHERELIIAFSQKEMYSVLQSYIASVKKNIQPFVSEDNVYKTQSLAVAMFAPIKNFKTMIEGTEASHSAETAQESMQCPWDLFCQTINVTVEEQVKLEAYIANALTYKLLTVIIDANNSFPSDQNRLHLDFIKLLKAFSNPGESAKTICRELTEKTFKEDITDVYKEDDILRSINENSEPKLTGTLKLLKECLFRLHSKHAGSYVSFKFNFIALGHEGVVKLFDTLNIVLKKIESHQTDNIELKNKAKKGFARIILKYVHVHYEKTGELNRIFARHKEKNDIQLRKVIDTAKSLCDSASVHTSQHTSVTATLQKMAYEISLSHSGDKKIIGAHTKDDKSAAVAEDSTPIPRSSSFKRLKAMLTKTNSSEASASSPRPGSEIVKGSPHALSTSPRAIDAHAAITESGASATNNAAPLCTPPKKFSFLRSESKKEMAQISPIRNAATPISIPAPMTSPALVNSTNAQLEQEPELEQAARHTGNIDATRKRFSRSIKSRNITLFFSSEAAAQPQQQATLPAGNSSPSNRK